jgi:hypothetical protein
MPPSGHPERNSQFDHYKKRGNVFLEFFKISNNKEYSIIELNDNIYNCLIANKVLNYGKNSMEAIIFYLDGVLVNSELFI